MLITFYSVPEPVGGGGIATISLSDCPASEVQAAPDWTVAQVLEAGGHGMYQAFTPVTPALEADLAVVEDMDLAQFLMLYGIDSEGRLLVNSWDDRLTWGEFTRAVDESLFAGDPSRIAVFQRGVAGGLSVDYLQQIVDLLLSPVSTALLGAIAVKIVHPKQLTDQIRQNRRHHIAEQLRKRNFTGPHLRHIINRYPEWDQDHLKRLFDFTDAEAIRVLVNAGYERRDDDGFWQRSSSAEAEARRDAIEGIDLQAWKDLNP